MNYLDAFGDKIEVGYVTLLVSNSVFCVERYEKELSKNEYLQIILEYIFLYLYCTGTWVDKMLPTKEGNELMQRISITAIGHTLRHVSRDWPKDQIDQMISNTMDKYLDRLKEYSSYNMFRKEENDSLAGTLFWEFAKKAARIAGNEHNPAAIIGHYKKAVIALKNIAPKEFVDRVKKLTNK